ncbi:erythromycin esterase family protein [Chitiniphilus purpureus]|uniref:Erythromycin esterase family protein n=1 Tax=Chitiniphilus purpureus TaxID=2981137 RepID=A0ABY6DPL2_9NEIS|nr:erythromycin esterase family protein [Chitiniphilus sp. CD1]UXY16291.1 erythromycin esterase family protein [Chitiniphilus sp. CD1]
MSADALPTSSRSSDDAAALLAQHARPLPPPDDAAFGAAFDAFGDARVVLLGEATHGSDEFYTARAAITRRLIEVHGFNCVALEADWPDAAQLDAVVRLRPSSSLAQGAFTRFPVWMWRNQPMRHFLDWLRGHNQGRPLAERVAIRGLDLYSLGNSVRAVLDYLDQVDPEAASQARWRYGCLTPWHIEPQRYGLAVRTGDVASCEDKAIEQLQQLLERRLSYLGQEDEEEGFFDAAQNARVVRAAEHYYRVMYRSNTESWNLRDRHMFDTLHRLLTRQGGAARVVVWAHNSHIGNAAATEMGWRGQFNLGELCRTAFGSEAVLIGLGTARGTVLAANDWDGAAQVKAVLPPHPDSHEALFERAAPACSLTCWRDRTGSELRQLLATPRLQRAIGVIYRPATERLSHYFEAVLAEQFDAYLWFAQTRALTPLPAPTAHGVPDTFPFGI